MSGNRFSAEAYRCARERSHAAAQWPSRAARANLAPQPDDSHSNLGWEADLAALAGWPLDASGHRLAVSFEPLELLWLAGNDIVARLPLAKASEAAVGAWCDQRLIDAGLQSASTAAMPYELSYSLDTAGSADAAVADPTAPLKRLGAAFGNAYAWLEKLVASYGHRAIVNPRVRCWPHHFDLATLFAMEEGDPETAPSVGVGLSPGDDSYVEPYFYCTPWPVPRKLPAPPAPMRWHTSGFTSMVCSAADIESADDPAAVLAGVFEQALAACQ